MRIQHNIMAMSAYRNYTNNVSAMKKNLEKLSSGYKINRAGDDAAGLAISEKMRAQITGLETAQKNAKDGISLVQTAEGALTEVHDMLNRMVELASQSANGTYDNTTDRNQLQKEINQLREEIDRIADSANFNGIQLLDGSMSASVTGAVSGQFELPDVGQVLGTNTVLNNKALTENGTEFSVDLHNFEFTGAAGDSMSINVGGSNGVTITLTAGSAAAGTKLSGDDLVEKFSGTAAGYTVTIGGATYTGGTQTFQIDGKDFTMAITTGADGKHLTFTQVDAPTTEADEVDGAMTVTLSGNVKPITAEYEVALGTKNSGTITIGTKAFAYTSLAGLKAAIEASTAGIAGFTAALDTAAGKITLTATAAGTVAAPKVVHGAAASETVSKKAGASGVDAVAATGGTLAGTATAGGVIAVATAGGGYATATVGALPGAGTTKAITVGGYTVTVNSTGAMTVKANATGAAGNATGVKIAYGASAAAAKTAADAADVDFTGGVDAKAQVYEVAVASWTGGDLTLKDGAGSDVTVSYDAVKSGATATVGNFTVALSSDGTTLTVTAKKAGATAADANFLDTAVKAAYVKGAAELTVDETKKGISGGPIGNITQGVNGDWNVSTTDIKNVYAGGRDRLASTYFDLDKGKVVDGASIKIADETYVFSTNKDTAIASGAIKVDISDLDTKASDYLSKVAKRLTEAAAGNEVYTVGHDGSRITLTETKEHAMLDTRSSTATYPADDWDLSTFEGIQKSLGFATPGTQGKKLTLQIGDTADDYNKLQVDIKDCHTYSIGDGTTSIKDISIATQEDAAKAVDVIKAAINYVSDVRGTLGATQNRLDHTINNLSVMTENIQDAESTIRDVDVAEEMMAYTKNNILIQSAQAMLAQANQVPQGVLQLLQ